MNKVDFDFMIQYSIDYFGEMLDKENENVMNNHFHYGRQFQDIYGNIKQRAYLIDKFFLVASHPDLGMIDKSVIFQAANIMDRYYQKR